MGEFPRQVSDSIYSPEHRKVVVEGINRVVRDARGRLPRIADEVEAWIRWHSSTGEPADYYMHPCAFPSFLLPWWAEQQITGTHDIAFQTDLAAATGNLYYYTRIVDNLMDNHPTVEQLLLPVAGYLNFQAQSFYRKYFPTGHPFWEWCDANWSEFCDACAKDRRLTNVDEDAFVNIVSLKCCGARLALGAVLYKYDRLDLLQPWMKWIAVYSCWHIMQEDLLDWKLDTDNGLDSFVLSEARRRKEQDELLVVWLAREGFEWAVEKCAPWMEQLREMEFVPRETLEFLQIREHFFQDQYEGLRPALKFISDLAAVGKQQTSVQGS